MRSEHYAQRLVAALEPKPSDVVVEIGAGQGILTGELLRSHRPARVYAIEIDPRLASTLRSQFGGLPNFELIEADVLELDLSRFGWFKVLANLPYSITTPILFKLLGCRSNWECAVLTLQAEFARRLMARPGGREYGRISVVIQFYTQIHRLLRIGSNCFWPRPSVASTAVRLEPRITPLVVLQDEAKFLRLVQTAFAQRRKYLVNALVDLIPRDEVLNSLSRLGLSPKVRAEELSPKEFGDLANVVHPLF